MDQPDRGAEPNFTQPVRQIITMLIVLGLFGGAVYVALPRVLPVFLANPYLNIFIAFVFVFGLFACFWQVLQLMTSIRWIRRVSQDTDGTTLDNAPRLLAPLASLMRARGARMQIGATSSRSILDSVATRIDEERDITRYITNLLIFLGLLGTFYGLATTVPAVVETIRSLAPSESDSGVDVFSRLMTGLENQLEGMGTAFSSSLLGLAGSLVVGMLELFATHGQNRFYRELEEYLSSITKFGFSPGDGEASGEPTGSGAWFAHMAEQMEALQTMFTQSDVSRAMVDDRLAMLAESVDRLTRRIEDEGVSTPYLIRMAESQDRLLEHFLSEAEEGGAHVDAESRMRLRSIDVQLLRILEEMSAGRQESLTELRADLAALTQSIRQASGRS